MKKTYACILSALVLTFTACEKDSATDESEQTAVTASEISNNLISSFGTVVEGEIPAEKGNISFDFIDGEENANGYIKTGFKLEFIAPANYAGSYIQVKAEDGSVASKYWNIPHFGTTGRTNKMNDTVQLNIGFTGNITPGEFCIDMSTYDDEGNVAEKKEKCVTIRKWGGNDDIIGTYAFVNQKRSVLIDIVGIGVDLELGEEKCWDSELECTSGADINYETCQTQKELIFTFNEDGTYEIKDAKKFKGIDHEKSKETCSVVYKDEINETLISKGMWSYHSGFPPFVYDKLTFIQFESQYSIEGEDDFDPVTLENGIPYIESFYKKTAFQADDEIIIVVKDPGKNDFVHMKFKEEN